MGQSENSVFNIRTAHLNDLAQLLELEKIWPVNARANEHALKFRLIQFPEGYFIAEDASGIIASIICCPYQYQSHDLSNYASWEQVSKNCYDNTSLKNALYIVSGTSRPTIYQQQVFNGGMQHVIDLAKKLGKQYVVGGSLIPGYASYIAKKGFISAADYVFKKHNQRYVDPLIEKYRRLGFYVPDKNHIIENYFSDAASLNYSALVVKDLKKQ